MLGPAGQRMSYGEAAGKVSLSRPVDVTAKRKSPAEQKIIGTSYPRVDIPAKVFGQQVFIHDLRPAGMLFGAVARPPAYAARLVSADLAAITGHAGRGRGRARRLVPGRGGAARGAGAGRRHASSPSRRSGTTARRYSAARASSTTC